MTYAIGERLIDHAMPLVVIGSILFIGMLIAETFLRMWVLI